MMHELKSRLASLFDVNVNQISLDSIEGGLSHLSNHCRLS